MSAGPPAENASAIDEVCLRLAYEQTRERAFSTTVSSSVTAFLLSREVAVPRLLAWLGVVLSLNVLRLAFVRWLHRAPRGGDELRRALPTFAFIQLVPAIVWSLLIVLAGLPDSIWVVTVISLSIGGMMASGAFTTSSTPRIFQASMIISVTPLAFHLLLTENLRGILPLVVVHVIAMSVATWKKHDELRRSIALRFENERLLVEVQREKENAERANREKSRFVAAASHDVRQPLHAMGLFLESLSERVLPDETKRVLRSIELAHRSLVSLHEGLLEVSVLETGGLTPHVQPVAIEALFATLENEASPRAREKGLELRFAGSELLLHTDAELLLRVLRNLVANALKYTNRGGVLVTARRRGDDALLQVWDTGIGIPHDQLERVFDELHQVNNPERNRAAGLGLGLAIVRRLSRALGSDVTVRSTPGRGSVFSMRVPLERGQPKETVAAGAVIVLVDDDGLARTALATLLERWGWEVVAAQSAEEARECLRELEQVDAVVSDLQLPGDSGLDLLSAVKVHKPGARRVLISGNTSRETDALVRQADVTFLRKPVSAAALKSVLMGRHE